MPRSQNPAGAWPKTQKAPLQTLLIFRAYIEVEGYKKGTVESAGADLLAAFKRHVDLVVLEDCVGATNLSLQQCQQELLLATGTLVKKPVGYNKTSIWRRAKKVVKVLRNEVHPAYLRAKAANEVGNSGTALEDKKKAVLKELWRSTKASPAQDEVEEEEEGEEEEQSELEEPKTNEQESSAEPVTPVRRSPRKHASSPSAQPIATPQSAPRPMPVAWSGPPEMLTWYTLGPFGDGESIFMTQMNQGPIDKPPPKHLLGSRGRKRQRTEAQKRGLEKSAAAKELSKLQVPEPKPQHALDSMADYRSQRMEELEKIIALKEKLKVDATDDINRLITFLNTPNPQLETAYGNTTPEE